RGPERGALDGAGDARYYGTYGTDREGNIVPEHGTSFSTSDALWVTRLNMLRKNDAQWITVTQPPIEWRDGSVQDIGVENWVAVTPLRTPNGLVGIFFNDAGLTGKPQDPTVQELVFLYASLLAHILTRKQLEVDLRQSLHKERELNELKSRFVS